MKKAIIFDYDGVIVSSEMPRFKLIQQILSKRNIAVHDNQFWNTVGRSITSILFEDYKDKATPEELDEMRTEYRKEYRGNIMNYIKPIKPTVDFITQYQGDLKLAIASNSPYEVIEKVLKILNIFSKFTAITTNDQVKNPKPDPEMYLVTAKKLGVEPEECIAIEDSVIGAQAALNADMTCYIVINPLNNEKQFVDMNIAGFIKSLDDYVQLTKDHSI